MMSENQGDKREGVKRYSQEGSVTITRLNQYLKVPEGLVREGLEGSANSVEVA